MIFKKDIPLKILKEKYCDEQSKFFAFEGIQVHYKDEGKGMPMVLLHGISASLHAWDDWTTTLKQFYRIIRVDLPGFGITGPNHAQDYSISYYCKFLHAFLQELGIDSFVLAGNSMGGEIAWNFANKYPEKVTHLILIDASGYYKRKEDLPITYKLAKNDKINWLMARLDVFWMNKLTLRQIFYNKKIITRQLEKRYYELTLRPGNRQAFVERIKLVGEEPIKFDLTTLKMPMLILWGEKDTWVPVVLAKRFHRDVPHAKLIIYPNVGHVPMEEAPEATVKDVLIFLQNA